MSNLTLVDLDMTFTQRSCDWELMWVVECLVSEIPSTFMYLQITKNLIDYGKFDVPECAFDCGNGECLYNVALKCDGTVDCSNRMDEVDRTCCKLEELINCL